jgi:hypothetical protein
MLEKIKLYIKQKNCNHYMRTTRWHWVHYPNSEPLSIEAEYQCTICGKIDYVHLYGKEAEQWAMVMGNYLRE